MNNVTPIQPEKARTCASCKFAETERMQGQIMTVLVCHRFPPTMNMIPVNGPQGQGIQAMCQFPIVQPAMHCHEYASREDTDGIAQA